MMDFDEMLSGNHSLSINHTNHSSDVYSLPEIALLMEPVDNCRDDRQDDRACDGGDDAVDVKSRHLGGNKS
jgi:hypothetical protein